MLLIGLTGGIASGKSTVSSMLRELGARVIDADQVAREVVAPGQPALLEIAVRFPGVVQPNGTLDRAQLAERVFGDENARTALNAIVHPRIQAAVLERTDQLARSGERLVIYDAPLLIENGLHAGMDGVVLVVVPRETQRRRLVERNGLTAEQAEARLASQLPLEQKVPLATWIIDNSGSLEETRLQVEAIWKELLHRARSS